MAAHDALVEHLSVDVRASFRIYSDVLQINADGMVLNDGEAQYRVAQWVRVCCDPSYRIEPPVEDWETELHL